MNEESVHEVISRIGNRLHNICCENQDSKLGEELGDMACDLWRAQTGLLSKEPQKQYKYEKVTESIFDLKDEFERGELYSTNSIGDGFYLIADSVYLAKEYGGGSPIYRKVEIDPVEELAREFLNIAVDKSKFTFDELSYALAKHAIDKLGSK
ncbi:hypothetical protein NVP1131O_64 [Vibrio phage 1.131.O._10N.222.49.A8]|nr:hypothetical protein NVP1131O_64 [Vibrio phage 1.131.O._10N.222.49.A8]